MLGGIGLFTGKRVCPFLLHRGPRSAHPRKAMGKESSCWDKMYWNEFLGLSQKASAMGSHINI